MMPTLRTWLLMALLAFNVPVAHSEIAVVVALDSPLQQLSPRQLSDIYLGRAKANVGERLLVLDHPRESALRERFFKNLNGMDLSLVNAYWARLQFSGETQPPIELKNSQTVLETLRGNRLAIGYVEMTSIDRSVRTLLTLKE